ncbi:high affinity copper transporter [Nannizzia gypsea CBS 118893]|uniref:Copper transport protein n=1 Tax=Arthroderma gypseum (strain ATCC MYA-4604 / CBS 118893) TaxID=535722 RepID=E5R362_ARTGP|nr:high affinity copper transporter [Nannizzia gypsea CBS 118893]EFQ97091.1 high affinity copper transporter [Nannizzia gypsea CBS 118893]
MDMAMMMTSSMPMPTGGHDMHHGMHHGMDHGMGGNQCKISMLWNWNVIDACFISSTWRITSRGMFAGSCIGVILLVMSLEFLRRLGREFDKHVAGQPSLFDSFGSGSSSTAAANSRSEYTEDSGSPKPTVPGSIGLPQPMGGRHSPTLLQHTLRSLLHMVQFGVAYFVMLLAMYYNGYFIICILIGAFLGHFVFSWKSKDKSDACEVTVCCG